MIIYLENEYGEFFTKEMETLIENVAKESLSTEKTELENDGFTVEISVTIVNNESIKEINNNFRKLDKTTDVLSFPLIEYDKKNKNECEKMAKQLAINKTIPIGDIIINMDKVTEQSKEYNHSFERELGFLVAHSMLHLLGYDHIEKSEEIEMFKKQEEILNKMGLVR